MRVKIKGIEMSEKALELYKDYVEKKAEAEGREVDSLVIHADEADPEYVHLQFVTRSMGGGRMRIKVEGNVELTSNEIMAYKEYVEAEAALEGREVDSLCIRVDEDDPEYVCLNYKYKPIKFERLRRITGYLVGTTDRWNDAKFAELQDRVKHNG